MSAVFLAVPPHPTGLIRGRWSERYGRQHVDIAVDPGRNRDGTEFRVDLERRWGPQFGDVRKEGFWLSREGAETLRNALSAALKWSAEDASDGGDA